MELHRFTLHELVEGLREARACAESEPETILRVRRLARRAVERQADWLTEAMCEPDRQQGFGFRLLHEEPDHTLAVFVASWLPGRGTPPHDHGTWAVVAGLRGVERNTPWRRLDDGSRDGFADIVPGRERLVAAGDIVTLGSDAIHSVANAANGVSASLHLYGRHVNHTARSQFDPVQRCRRPYLVATTRVAAIDHAGALS
jgi:predicted metal-dependent enzyme (double-stranded beta helix superfamily)